MAQMVTFENLPDNPNWCASALLALDLSHTGNGLCLAKGHTVWAHTLSSQIKGLPHIWQFHAPAVVFAGRGATIEFCAAFIASELVHLPAPILCTRIVPRTDGNDKTKRQSHLNVFCHVTDPARAGPRGDHRPCTCFKRPVHGRIHLERAAGAILRLP